MSKLKEKLANQLEEIQDTDFEVIPDDKVTVIPPEDDVVPTFTTLNEAKERLKILKDFVQEVMTPGLDYGLIPGSKKPCLFKSGGEKLCLLFNFGIMVMVTNRVEHWDNNPFIHYECKVRLYNKKTGQIESEGVGCANNKEKKFIKQDPCTISNSILKISRKRAFLDAVLSATQTSNYFTQDLDDMDDSNAAPSQKPSLPVSEGQLQKIYQLARDKEISADTAKRLLMDRYKVEDSRLLTFHQADLFIKYLSAL